MITITPVRRALIPIDSSAAARISAPNYDEFQSDREIWDLLQDNPMSVLRVTMAHCQADSPETISRGDSRDALAKATVNMEELRASELTEEVRDILWVYEIEDPNRPDVRQIGLGGMGRTDEIRTDATPRGTIIRNEGVREPKARGRADLIQATHAIIGMVNNGVDDASGEFQNHLEAHADGVPPDFEVVDQGANRHRVWICRESRAIQRFGELLAEEPHAYVADGNHRSAAAAMLGYANFLSVFFPARTMGIRPYNRLVRVSALPTEQLTAAIGEKFGLDTPAETGPYQPTQTHDIGLYTPDRGWLRLRPIPGTFDPDDASAVIDSGIVQKNLFAQVFGIADAGDYRLTFVGSNKDAAWLQREVDEGRATYAVTLAAVTMNEFIEVCRQNRHMPPKSTWFEPKVRSGLVMALLDS
ncbi:MAG TPA: hypothetical protein DIU18_02375 [Gemmatimonadetes bacterium]|nr:hypothetical protein [Gemmatimonadota bacterium]|tara:strand:- start:14594 stop:15841 length:1248 start_codon:yes stop_codon:yes gene_type:complete